MPAALWGSGNAANSSLLAEIHRLQVLSNPTTALTSCTRPLQAIHSTVLALGVVAVHNVVHHAPSPTATDDGVFSSAPTSTNTAAARISSQRSQSQFPAPPVVDGMLTSASVDQRIQWLLDCLQFLAEDRTKQQQRQHEEALANGVGGIDDGVDDGANLAHAERRRLIERRRGHEQRAAVLQSEAADLRAELQLMERKQHAIDHDHGAHRRRVETPTSNQHRTNSSNNIPSHSPDCERSLSPPLPGGSATSKSAGVEFLDVHRTCGRLRQGLRGLRADLAALRSGWLGQVATLMGAINGVKSVGVAGQLAFTSSGSGSGGGTGTGTGGGGHQRSGNGGGRQTGRTNRDRTGRHLDATVVRCSDIGGGRADIHHSLPITAGLTVAVERAHASHLAEVCRLQEELRRRLEGIDMTLEDRASRTWTTRHRYRKRRLLLKTRQRTERMALEKQYVAGVGG